MSVSFCKKLAFFIQKSPLTQSNNVRAVLDLLVLFSVFVRQKVTFTESRTFSDSVSEIQPPNCSKLVKNWKITMTSQFSEITSSSNFLTFFVSLVEFSCWFKFHVNIITGSGIMTIFFYKGLTRNPEIGNTPVWVLSDIWRLGRVMDTKFGATVFNRMLLNAAKFQGYNFNCFWLIKRKPTGGKITPPLPATQIRVKSKQWRFLVTCIVITIGRF